MTSAGDENISKAFILAKAMKDLAEVGQSESEDDGCLLLFGVIRDYAYAIKRRAEEERRLHEGLRE